jgi:hypothetical protein
MNEIDPGYSLLLLFIGLTMLPADASASARSALTARNKQRVSHHRFPFLLIIHEVVSLSFLKGLRAPSCCIVLCVVLHPLLENLIEANRLETR